MSVIAIIPARSGSKRFKSKNIANFLGIPLLLHSINFAKKLRFVEKIVLTSDSTRYLKLAKNIPNVITHKRSKKNSEAKSMEQDVLRELIVFFKKKNIKISGI